MLDAPIFNIKLLFVAYLLVFALTGSGTTVESTATAVDFFHQKFLPASTLLNRRAETRRAASEDGMLGKTRIWQVRVGGAKEKGKLRAVIQTKVWRHQVSVDHVVGKTGVDWYGRIKVHSREGNSRLKRPWMKMRCPGSALRAMPSLKPARSAMVT
jgi:hypothetical protein